MINQKFQCQSPYQTRQLVIKILYITNTSMYTDSPYDLYKGHPFSQCCMAELDQHTQPHYQNVFSNRSVAYYGLVPYCYGNVLHQAVPFESNSYLLHIVTLLRNLLPNYIFNSALITKFKDGNDHIGLHSDDEPSIVCNSDILTISLGETRTLVFEPKIILMEEVKTGYESTLYMVTYMACHVNHKICSDIAFGRTLAPSLG